MAKTNTQRRVKSALVSLLSRQRKRAAAKKSTGPSKRPKITGSASDKRVAAARKKRNAALQAKVDAKKKAKNSSPKGRGTTKKASGPPTRAKRTPVKKKVAKKVVHKTKHKPVVKKKAAKKKRLVGSKKFDIGTAGERG